MSLNLETSQILLKLFQGNDPLQTGTTLISGPAVISQKGMKVRGFKHFSIDVFLRDLMLMKVTWPVSAGLQVRAEIWSPGFRISRVDLCTSNPEYSKKHHKLGMQVSQKRSMKLGLVHGVTPVERHAEDMLLFSFHIQALSPSKYIVGKCLRTLRPLFELKFWIISPKDPWPGIVTVSWELFWWDEAALRAISFRLIGLLLEGCWGAEPVAVADVPAVLTEVLDILITLQLLVLPVKQSGVKTCPHVRRCSHFF